MLKLYVAYEEGVYRQNTIGVSESEADLLPKIMDYFKSADDYHSVQVCELSEEHGEVNLYRFNVNSDRVYINKESWRGTDKYTVRHGKRTITKDGELFMVIEQSHVMKEGESFCS